MPLNPYTTWSTIHSIRFFLFIKIINYVYSICSSVLRISLLLSLAIALQLHFPFIWYIKYLSSSFFSWKFQIKHVFLLILQTVNFLRVNYVSEYCLITSYMDNVTLPLAWKCVILIISYISYPFIFFTGFYLHFYNLLVVFKPNIHSFSKYIYTFFK